MIFEYALEPELVATWTDKREFRYFIERFGLGQGRVVSRYPKRWSRLVWEASNGTNDLERKRLEELLARLTERMVRRADPLWANGLAWLENTEREDNRCPFFAILARENPRSHPRVLTGDEAEDGSPLWVVDHGTVGRSAAEMACAVASVLRCSSTVIFVDPHFGPERDRYVRSLAAFLEQMAKQRPGLPASRVEVLTSADSTGTSRFFREECNAKLCGIVPKGTRLVLRRLRTRSGGEKLHNRYILTELGGIFFGIGLDAGKLGQSDDLSILTRSQYERRWKQYNVSLAEDFEQTEDPVEVEGTRSLR